MKAGHYSFVNEEHIKAASLFAAKHKDRYVKIRIKDYENQFGVIVGDSYFYAVNVFHANTNHCMAYETEMLEFVDKKSHDAWLKNNVEGAE